MKKISLLFVLCIAPLLSCVGARVVPSPDPAKESCVLAWRIDFGYRGVLNSVIGFDEPVSLSCVRAARLTDGKPGASSATNIISGGTAFFAGLEPGEYVITDLVFEKEVGGHSGGADAGGRSKFIIASLSGSDGLKTKAEAAAGMVCYGGHFKIRADSSVKGFVLDFSLKKKEGLAVTVDKGYGLSSFSADDIVPVTSVESAAAESDAEAFRQTAAAVLAGSGWAQSPVKDR